MYATRAAHDGRALEGGGGAEHEGYENALHLYLGWYLRECEVNACCLELLQLSSRRLASRISRGHNDIARVGFAGEKSEGRFRFFARGGLASS